MTCAGKWKENALIMRMLALLFTHINRKKWWEENLQLHLTTTLFSLGTNLNLLSKSLEWIQFENFVRVHCTLKCVLGCKYRSAMGEQTLREVYSDTAGLLEMKRENTFGQRL